MRTLSIAHILVFTLLCAGPAAAAGQAAPEAAAPATLVVENRPVVTFRVPFATLSPSQRVEDAVRRIAALEDLPDAPPRPP